MSEFAKMKSWLSKGSTKGSFPGFGKKVGLPKGFTKENPIVVEAEVENFETFAYAQVSMICELSGQPWEIISIAERWMKGRSIIELEFSIKNTIHGKEPIIQSMYFDITPCLDNPNRDRGGESLNLNWPEDKPDSPVDISSFLTKGNNRNRANQRNGFKSFRGF